MMFFSQHFALVILKRGSVSVETSLESPSKVANHPPLRLMDEDALWAVPLGGVEGHKVRPFVG